MNASNDLKPLLEKGFNSHVNGDLATARQCYEQALTLAPTNGPILHALGLIALALGEHACAVGHLQRAAELVPNNPSFHTHLGIALAGLNRFADAAAAFEKAVALDPNNAEGHFNLGTMRRDAGEPDAAAASFGKAVALNPNDAEFLLNYGSALLALARLAEAETHLGKALALQPGNAQCHYQLGLVRARQDRIKEAATCFETAIALDASLADAHYNLGWMKTRLGRVKEATAHYDRAVALAPHEAEFQFNLSTALLAQGDFARGWPLNVWRLRFNPASIQNPKGLPLADANTPSSTPVLVVGEQGFGDDLQFCRYLPLLKARFPNLRLRARPALARLFRESFEGIEVYSDPAADAPDAALLPLMSAPAILGTAPDTIPATTPYLKVPAEVRRLRLPASPRPRIGISWAGRPNVPGFSEFDGRRSIAVELLHPLLAQTGVDWVALQLGRPDDLCGLAEAGYPLQDVGAGISDFADTAALVEQLDLVIAVDTAVAHLAGALGKPVWLLNRFDSCWRWFLEREDSPWYPTMRIFRQSQPGDWSEVITRVSAALADWLAARATPAR